MKNLSGNLKLLNLIKRSHSANVRTLTQDGRMLNSFKVNSTLWERKQMQQKHPSVKIITALCQRGRLASLINLVFRGGP